MIEPFDEGPGACVMHVVLENRRDEDVHVE